MKIIKLATGAYEANCYIVYSASSKDGIVIDPGGDADIILKKIKTNNINIKYIVLTHGHGDHIGGVSALQEALNIPLLIHQDEMEMIQNPRMNLSSIMGGSVSLKADKALKDGDIISFGDLKALVIHTPGHSRGGICIEIDKHLFTGDTLFKGSIGRTDLTGGDYETLMDSIKNKILTLDNATVVLPGHGENSTIEVEKMENPYLR